MGRPNFALDGKERPSEPVERPVTDHLSSLAVSRYTFIILLVLLFQLPVRWISPTAIGFTFGRIIGALAAILWVISVIQRRNIRRPTPFHIGLAAFVAFSILSISWGVPGFNELSAAFRASTALNYVIQFSAAFIIWDVFRTHDQVEQGLQAYVIGAWILAFALILGFGDNGYGVRRVAFESNPNFVGLALAFAMPIAVSSVVSRGVAFRDPLTLANLAFLPVAAFGIALTGSRQAFVAALIGVGVYLLARGFSLTRLLEASVVSLIGVLSLLIGVPVGLRQRFLGIPRTLLTLSLPVRRSKWLIGLRYYVEGNPLTGLGSGATKAIVRRHYGRVGMMDNTFLSTLINFGLIGLGLLVLTLVFLGRDAIRFDGRYSNLLAAFLIVFLSVGLVQESLFRAELWLLPSLVLAGCYISDSKT